MATILYPSPIVGPIHSRRLGISLGVNVNPSDGKICTFDCIYCEVGYNRLRRPTLPQPSRELIAERLEQKLKEMRAASSKLDVITFSGNGEPQYVCATPTIPRRACRCSLILRWRTAPTYIAR